MWTSRIVPFLFVAASAVFAAAPACDRAGPSPSGEEAATDAPEQADGLLESKGDSCSRDTECSGYLRCLDETCSIPPAVDGDVGEESPRVRFHVDDSNREPVRFYVELATNPAQRRRGLMYRKEMQDDWGMLFVYDSEAPRNFWMKNTYIPLDMIFMDAAGTVVQVVHEAEPRTTTPRSSEKPARFVLEVNGGRAREVGIETGDQMRVQNIPDEYAPAP